MTMKITLILIFQVNIYVSIVIMYKLILIMFAQQVLHLELSQKSKILFIMFILTVKIY